jgi:hypothetical protein
MLRALLVTLAAAVPAIALAAPPVSGSTHTFLDPVFKDTVICDTLEQVRAIATAKQPQVVYSLLYATPNAIHEPTCAAVVPTGVVLEVVPIGRMERDGQQFEAYAVKASFLGKVAYALYLEQFRMVQV